MLRTEARTYVQFVDFTHAESAHEMTLGSGEFLEGGGDRGGRFKVCKKKHHELLFKESFSLHNIVPVKFETPCKRME